MTICGGDRRPSAPTPTPSDEVRFADDAGFADRSHSTEERSRLDRGARALRSNLRDVDRALGEDRDRHVRAVRAVRERDRPRAPGGAPVGDALCIECKQAGERRERRAAASGRPEALVPRVLVVVCDSWGVGGGARRRRVRRRGLRHPGQHLPRRRRAARAGPGVARARICSPRSTAWPRGRSRGTAHGWAVERSAGKDTTTGHWEMMGIRLDEPFPLYPDGFPPEVVEPFERAIGHRILGNEPASGTEIIARLGEEHLRDRRPDRVHERRFGVPDRVPQGRGAARAALRVVPRRPRDPGAAAPRRPGDRAPVRGHPRARSSGAPSVATCRCRRPGRPCSTRSRRRACPCSASGRSRTSSTARASPRPSTPTPTTTGSTSRSSYLGRPGPSFVFTNLVDFDSKYGHRNDPAGYAAAIEAFDRRLPDLVGRARRRRAAHHRRPRVRPDDAADRPLAGAHPVAGGRPARGTARDRERGRLRRPRLHGRRRSLGSRSRLSMGSSFADSTRVRPSRSNPQVDA